MSPFEKWIISGFAIIGAFLSVGIGAYGIASIFSIWTTPYAGFSAAFGAVYIAGITAPKNFKAYSIFVFILGILIAYLALHNYTYPESYTGKEYQPTLIPLIATLFGGILGLIINLVFLKGANNET